MNECLGVRQHGSSNDLSGGLPQPHTPHSTILWQDAVPHFRLAAGRDSLAARLTLLVILAAVLRIIPWLARYPLHQDEALYGFWARLIASGQDPLLLTPWIDKPPLAIYIIAGSFKLLGVSEMALRLPGMAASLITVLAVYGLGRRAHGPDVGLLAALLFALSPFAILFAPTGFTDPWLTLWLTLSGWAALARQPLWAGVALGLAVASKQQGVLAAPWIVGLLLLSCQGRLANGRSTQPNAETDRRRRMLAISSLLASAVLGFLLILAPLTYWDSLRWHNRPSFWDRSITTYGGLGLAPVADWSQRAADWAHQLSYLFASPVVTGLVIGLAVLAPLTGGRTWGFDRVTSTFIAAYLILHIVVAFQPWDRYLLPLLPLICVLAARGLVWGWSWIAAHAAPAATADENARRTRAFRRFLPSRGQPAKASNPGRRSTVSSRRSVIFRAGFAVVLALLLGHAAWLGASGQLPVGSDRGAHSGLDLLASSIAAQPRDAIIYHHSLGWYFDFYLFDAGQERRWWDTTQKLADDAAATAQTEPERGQWLALTDREEAAAGEIRTALARRGLALVEAERFYRSEGSRSFTLYRIEPAGGQDAR